MSQNVKTKKNKRSNERQGVRRGGQAIEEKEEGKFAHVALSFVSDCLWSQMQIYVSLGVYIWGDRPGGDRGGLLLL